MTAGEVLDMELDQAAPEHTLIMNILTDIRLTLRADETWTPWQPGPHTEDGQEENKKILVAAVF